MSRREQIGPAVGPGPRDGVVVLRAVALGRAGHLADTDVRGEQLRTPLDGEGGRDRAAGVRDQKDLVAPEPAAQVVDRGEGVRGLVGDREAGRRVDGGVRLARRPAGPWWRPRTAAPGPLGAGASRRPPSRRVNPGRNSSTGSALSAPRIIRPNRWSPRCTNVRSVMPPRIASVRAGIATATATSTTTAARTPTTNRPVYRRNRPLGVCRRAVPAPYAAPTSNGSSVIRPCTPRPASSARMPRLLSAGMVDGRAAVPDPDHLDGHREQHRRDQHRPPGTAQQTGEETDDQADADRQQGLSRRVRPARHPPPRDRTPHDGHEQSRQTHRRPRHDERQRRPALD